MTFPLYAILVALISLVLGYAVYRFTKRKAYAAGTLLIVAAVLLLLWYAVFENIAARKWGGTLTIHLPENARLMNMTWKEDSVWYLYYDPASGTCVFKEDSRHGLIEGGVVVKSCNPLGLQK